MTRTPLVSWLAAAPPAFRSAATILLLLVALVPRTCSSSPVEEIQFHRQQARIRARRDAEAAARAHSERERELEAAAGAATNSLNTTTARWRSNAQWNCELGRPPSTAFASASASASAGAATFSLDNVAVVLLLSDLDVRLSLRPIQKAWLKTFPHKLILADSDAKIGSLSVERCCPSGPRLAAALTADLSTRTDSAR